MRGIYWFRKDLRLNDNIALLKATQLTQELIPIYIIHTPKTPCGPNRWQFLLDSLRDLKQQLEEMGSGLVVVRGDSEEVLERMVGRFGVDVLLFEVMHEPWANQRDSRVTQLLSHSGDTVTGGSSSTSGSTTRSGCKVIAVEEGRLLFNHAKFEPCFTYRGFTSQIPSKVTNPLPNLTSLPPFPSHLFTQDELDYFPQIQEFTSSQPETTIRGGSKEAQKRLATYCQDIDKVTTFEKPKTSPAEFIQPSTTQLSPYIVWGCISIRTIYHKIQSCIEQSEKRESKPPVSLIGQLYWREFYYFQSRIVPNYHQMEGNSICRQIPWKPALPPNTSLPKDPNSAKDPNSEGYELLQKWKTAKTGYPWIDAIITQLNKTGWTHHLARHSIACFLTRGNLFIHWERGLEHFQQTLIDHDYALNAGNWQWLSASAYFHQYFRVYSPITFGRKYDRKGVFVRRWLPQFEGVPDRFVYEPWLMTEGEQRRYGCVLGRDYPERCVDHSVVREECLGWMKDAFEQNRAVREGRSEVAGEVGSGDVGGGKVGGKRKRIEVIDLTKDE